VATKIEKRYFRNDKRLLTEPTNALYSKEILSEGSPQFMFAMKISTSTKGNITNYITLLKGEFNYKDLTLTIVTVDIPELEINLYDSVTVSFYLQRNTEWVFVQSFTTESLEATFVGGNSWDISFYYKVSQDYNVNDKAFWFYYGTDDTCIYNFRYGIASPEAKFTYSPENVIQNIDVTFNASESKGLIQEYTWLFYEPSGNLWSTQYGKTVTVKFPECGNWKVTLKVRDSYNQVDEETKTIYVEEYVLIPDFTYTFPAYVGEMVTFNASKTYGMFPPFTYHWNFDDKYTAEGETVIYTFETEGQHIVKLTVTDSNNVSNSSTKTILVREVPKAVINYSPKNPKTYIAITLDGSQSSGTNLTYRWLIDNDYVLFGEKVEVTFDTVGTHYVSLTVNDNYRTDTETISLYVEEYPLEPNFTFSTPIYEKETVTFDASTTIGDYPPFEYRWNFGDNCEAEGEKVTHEYAFSKDYTVTLFVTDSNGVTVSIQKTVHVRKLPKAVIQYCPQEPSTYEEVTFDASQSQGEELHYTWQIEEEILEGKIVRKVFVSSGEKRISLTVTDGYRSDTTSITIYIYGRLQITLGFIPVQFYNKEELYDLVGNFSVTVQDTYEKISPDTINVNITSENNKIDLYSIIEISKGLYQLRVGVYNYFKDMKTRSVKITITVSKEHYQPATATAIVEMQAPQVFVGIISTPKLNDKELLFKIKNVYDEPVILPTEYINVTIINLQTGETRTTNNALTIEYVGDGNYKVYNVDFSTVGQYLVNVRIYFEGEEYSFSLLVKVSEESIFEQIIKNPVLQFAIIITIILILYFSFKRKRT